MPQIFHRRANTIARVVVFGGIFLLAAVLGIGIAVAHSPYVTGLHRSPEQPVPFSHAHHVGDLGIDCRYCHTSVERTAFAGIPPTHTCMTCHSQIWTDAAVLEPVRESYRTGRPLHWQRVYDLPDFVYFNHSIHVHQGIGCVTCHGRVDKMPRIEQAQALNMSWCLSCHIAPERQVRPREHVFDLAWRPTEDQLALGTRLVRRYSIAVEQLRDCSICHR